MEVKKNIRNTKVLMELYNRQRIRTPILLSKAIELIDKLPTSVELKENFISFENELNQKILLKRLFYNVWRLELIFNSSSGKRLNLEYKYLRTRVVKVLVINFFYGIFVGTQSLGTLSLTLTHHESRSQHLKEAIKIIDMKLKKFTHCQYCGVKLRDSLKLKCEFCGIELNFIELLLV
jgi:hypothetical protein